MISQVPFISKVTRSEQEMTIGKEIPYHGLFMPTKLMQQLVKLLNRMSKWLENMMTQGEKEANLNNMKHENNSGQNK